MPRKGENLLERFASAVVRGQGWSFGNPFVSDGATAVILPVLRTALRPRRYVLAEEVADEVRAEDLGRIDRLRIWNDTASRVFLRPGTLFAGGETQSRATTAGTLLNPKSHTDIEVKCVQASRPVVEGVTLHLAPRTAPDPVLRALLTRDQGLVWTTVHEAVVASRGRTAGNDDRLSPLSGSDDLVGALPEPAIDDAAAEAYHRISGTENQCGIVVLDARGVIAAELFDSPDSWKRATRGIFGRYADLVRPTPTSAMKTTVEAETAIGLTKDFLTELREAASRRLPQQGRATVAPLAATTALDDEVIHLIAYGPQRISEPPRIPFLDSEREVLPERAGTLGFDSPHGPLPQTAGAMGAEDGEVAVAGGITIGIEEDSEGPTPPPRVMKRKVLTSGWDPTIFHALEHYSHKEFRGDRSGAMRFLVRLGLQRRGYLGPQPVRETPPFPMSIFEAEGASAAAELGRAGEEAKIRDFERIAMADQFAGWLRKRARLELERIASSTEDELLRIAAQSALDRIPPPPAPVEVHEVEHVDIPQPAPPVDVTALLRRALTASAAGNYTQALALFDEALDAEPLNTTALLGRAVAFRRAGKKQEALAGLDLVLRLEPRNAAALLNRGRLLQERGDLEDSLETFDLLVKVAPNDWDVWKERGDVLLRLGEDDAALRSYAEALRRNPDDEDLQRRSHALEKTRAGPLREGPHPVTLPPGVEEGQSYLAKERRPDLSYRIFKGLAEQKVPSLWITRQPLDRLRQEPGLAGVQLIGLSHARGADLYSPTALVSLSRAIERFVEEHHGRGVILLDGLENLIASNDFRSALLFIERVNELVVQRKAIFLLSVAPESLPEKEMALVERDLNALS